MKQVLQDMDSGGTFLVDAPSPSPSAGTVLIATSRSLISAGTERMLVEFGKASYIEKARQQPDKVRQVLAKVQTDGLSTTIEAVRAKLAQPIPLGYCNFGKVIAVGHGVDRWRVGDRVVSNGPHAEIVRVPANLCARVPDNVSAEAAAFTVIASIGLQGIRLVEPTLGERVVVTGVGLIGLLTVQLLRAHGCHVLALDYDEKKLELARSFGAETCNLSEGGDALVSAEAFSRGRGVDAVIITASTKSSEPVAQAAKMSRKRGRIVLVGVTGLELNRADFYEKELSFKVSCSYGPGRYDSGYEQGGHDYPFGFVRWTEQRNFEAVLDLLSDRRIAVEPLISHRVPFSDATRAYELLAADSSALGVVLEYPTADSARSTTTVRLLDTPPRPSTKPTVGLIGAGNYGSRMLIPALKEAGATLHSVITTAGITGVIQGRVAGFVETSTDAETLFSNSAIDTVVVATRHDTHPHFVSRALISGRHVFVEKPLAIDEPGLDQVRTAYENAQATPGGKPHLMVGFNRRFAPHIQHALKLLDASPEPRAFIMTMNAGRLPADHWTHDPLVGGGRVVGEACHYVDLMRYMAGAPITAVSANRMRRPLANSDHEENATISLEFGNGSFGTIIYLANGTADFPKERIEVFCGGRILQIDNFRKMRGFGWKNFDKMNLWSQDKGQTACVQAFLGGLASGVPAIPPDQIFEVAGATLEAARLLRRS
jgi:threonine dehydrogenase-like Zn-dependent dehydrogenase/predicted dehydrogenase